MTRPRPAFSPPSTPQAAMLAGGRLHLQEGPIDLIIGAEGAPEAVRAAYAAARARFSGLLATLCGERDVLRRPVTADSPAPEGDVARKMWAAVRPFGRKRFITPMAAVAGAVADDILAAMPRAGLDRAYVNNGGDIALFLAPDAHFTIGLVDRPDAPRLIGTARVTAESGIAGVATSGWRGRSFSLGIADAVTILAPTAAMADAAATVIANDVDLPGRPGILRVPANDLQPDSDLGARLVTRHVPDLPPEACAAAIAAGLATGRALMARGLILGLAIHVQGHSQGLGAAAPCFLTSPQEEGRIHA